LCWAEHLLSFDSYLYTIFKLHYTGWFRSNNIFSMWYCRSFVRNKIHINMYLLLNGYRYAAVWMWRAVFVRYLCVALDEWRSLQKEVGYTRRIAGSHSECCCSHKETLRSNQTENKRSSYMRLTVGCSDIYIEL
jgi:hypothetical protein